MDSLTFLYWSLGIGWAVLIFFLCIALIYVIRILRDLANTTNIVSKTANTMNDNVSKITDIVLSTAEQISEYIIKPFTAAQFLIDKIKPFVDMMQKKGIDFQSMVDNVEEDDDKKKKKKAAKKKT